jgi:hypothetical protein
MRAVQHVRSVRKKEEWECLSDQLADMLAVYDSNDDDDTKDAEGEPDPPPPPLGEVLPTELQRRVLSSLSLRSAARLAATCTAFNHAFRSLPPHDAAFRRGLLRRLGLGSTVQTAGEASDGAIDWRAACVDTHALLHRLKTRIVRANGQKYLRWIDGAPGDAPPVRHVLVGVSLLPERLERCFADELPRQGELTPQYGDVLRFLFDDPFIQSLERRQLHEEEAACAASRATDRDVASATAQRLAQVSAFLDGMEEAEPRELHGSDELARLCDAAARAFDLRRFHALVEWVLADERRLPLLLADFDQIFGRDRRRFLESVRLSDVVAQGEEERRCADASLGRQVGSFVQLSRLANRDPDGLLNYWAG